MRKRILYMLFLGVLVIGLVGCGNNAEEEKSSSKSKESVKEQEDENVTFLDYDRAAEFNDGVAVVSKTENFESTYYVIDEDFNVLFSYKGNQEFVGGYIKIPAKDDEKQINILNKNGEVIYSYDDKEYKKKVELVSNGLLVITEQTDTYNSSKTVTGIYDLESKKYVLEPDEKYKDKIRQYGDFMLTLNSDYTEFFNTRTKKVVKFTEAVQREFVDGYSLEEDYRDNEIYVLVYDDSGNKKEIKTFYKSVGSIKNHSNGMLFDAEMRIVMENYNEKITGENVQLFDLKNGTVKDLSKLFIFVEKPKFNKDGNALVRFSNQGGETYYTVIDKNGEMLFEPVKRNNEASFGAESNEVPLIVKEDTLYHGGYFIAEEDSLSKVIDKNNKVVVTSDDEDETFESITNNSIIVKLKKPGSKEISYYKDLEGNKINLKIHGDLKEYN